MAVEWDNEFEERVSGRLLSVSSSVCSIIGVNEAKKLIELRGEYPNDKPTEISFADFMTKFRMTIK